MTKLEKVIYSLERCTRQLSDACMDCAYYESAPACWQSLKRDALEPLEKRRWVSVKDRLPALDGEYLCWFGDYPMGAHYRICRYTNGKGFYCYTDNFKWPFITHWMHLPEPPRIWEDEK